MLQISTLKVLGLLNFLGFAAIVLVCELLTKGSTREKVLGGICVGFSVIVFAAPLSIMVRIMYVHAYKNKIYLCGGSMLSLRIIPMKNIINIHIK